MSRVLEESSPNLWTVGHSSLGIAAFMDLLRAHGIEALLDVRAFPVSRRYPHFSGDRLAAAWEDYHWLGQELGGYRKDVRLDSPHTALDGMWRAYADHMETKEFRAGIARVMSTRAPGSETALQESASHAPSTASVQCVANARSAKPSVAQPANHWSAARVPMRSTR